MGEYNKWDYQSDYHRQDRLERNIESSTENYDEFDWGVFISLEFDFLYDLKEEYEKWDPRFQHVSIADLSKSNHVQNTSHVNTYNPNANYDNLTIESFAYVVSERYIDIFKELNKYIDNTYENIKQFHESEEYNMYYKDFYDDYYNLTNYNSIVYNFYERVSEGIY
jgi:hypothetical protein